MIAYTSRSDIVVIADDLTGAADSVAPFTRVGRPAYVTAGLNPIPPREDPSAIAISTNTRDLSVGEENRIVWRVRGAVRAALTISAPVLYKKVDSTLRGHLAVELDAVRTLVPGRIVIICTAFPANGRTVENGILCVRDADTGRDLGGNGRQTVADSFGVTDRAEVGSLPLSVLRSGAPMVAQAIRGHERAGKRLLLADAVTPEDLSVLASVICGAPERFLPVGSAGLSRAIAAVLGYGESPGRLPEEARHLTRKRVLLIVGTPHPISREQAACFSVHSGIAPIELRSQRDVKRVADGVRSQFQAGQRIVLITAPQDIALEFRVTAFCSVMKRLKGEMMVSGEPLLQCVIATGGDTALSMLQALDHNLSLTVLGELEPGVVLAYPASSSEIFPLLVMKSGGFGRRNALLQWVGYL